MFKLHIHFQIPNVFKSPGSEGRFKSIWDRSGKITTNKCWELELYFSDFNLLGFDIRILFSGEDHAGPAFEICLLGWTFGGKIYDRRHWDHKNGRWEEIEEHEEKRDA